MAVLLDRMRVVILSDRDDMKAVALNLMRFFEDESCGQCTPCRAGTEKAVKLMANRPLGRGAADGTFRPCGMPRYAGSVRPRRIRYKRAEIFSRRAEHAIGKLVTDPSRKVERNEPE